MISTTFINGKEIRYEFKRSHRRSVAAKIRRDGVIEVKAPLLYRESDMIAFLNQHKRWIFNHYDKLQNIENQEKKYVSGEIHYYLGEKYTLQVVQSDKNSVLLDGNSLIVNIGFKEKSVFGHLTDFAAIFCYIFASLRVIARRHDEAIQKTQP